MPMKFEAKITSSLRHCDLDTAPPYFLHKIARYWLNILTLRYYALSFFLMGN